MSLSRRLYKLQALSINDMFMILPTTVRLVSIELMIRNHGYRYAFEKTIDKQTRYILPNPSSKEVLQLATPLVHVISAARILAPVEVRCLARSLYLHRQMLRAGIETIVIAGISIDRIHESSLDHPQNDFAHAWVEWNDLVLNDRSDIRESYVALPLNSHK